MTLVFLVFDDPFIFPSHSSVLQIIYTAHAARIMTGVIVRVNQPYHSPILSGAGVFMIFFPEIDLFIISDRGDRYFCRRNWSMKFIELLAKVITGKKLTPVCN